MLQIEKLSKVYPNGTRALREVTFTTKQSEFVVIIGLSGSGKSTLLRCVNRLIEPTAGTVTLDGENLTRARPRQLRAARSRIGMVFQQFNLVRRASVLTNVMNGALGRLPAAYSAAGYFPREVREEAMRNLERVGLADRAAQRADTLSGGQQQRVGIARALMQRPRLILADEPVASLDPATSHSVLKYLRALNREDGVTILCNLHFLSLAREYGTRVIALRDGELVFDGPPEAVDKRWFHEIYGEEAAEVEIE
jgi:phosphonate transport system ATP-binding protein